MVRKKQNQREEAEFGSSIYPQTTTVANMSIEIISPIVAAFLNTDGGRVLIGITPDSRVHGVMGGESVSLRLENGLEMEIAPRPTVSIVRRPVGKREILLVDVPVGSQQPYVFRDRIYVWRKDEAQLATPEDISHMILRKSEQERRWEREPALGISLVDLDEKEIWETSSMCRRRLIGAERIPEEPLRFLEYLDLVRGGEILNSAVVLFGERPAIRMPQTRVRVATFRQGKRPSIAENLLLEGNLFNIFEEVIKFFDRSLPMTSVFSEESVIREDEPKIPTFMIREAVMNALIHRDYSELDANVTISLYPERIELWNPGTLLTGLDAERLAHLRVSRRRNPDIAHVAYLRGLVEQFGTGAQRILIECRESGLPDPVWEEVGGGVRLTLQMVTEPRETMTRQLDRRLLEFLRESYPGQRITLKEYHSRWGRDVSYKTAQRDLRRLVSLGYLIELEAGHYSRTDL